MGKQETTKRFIAKKSLAKKNTPKKNRSWDDSFAALVAFQKATGSLKVSRNYDSGLAHWMSDQRRHLRKQKLSKEQRQMLEDVGFDFRRQRADDLGWDYWFQQMKEFKRKHGHTCCKVDSKFNRNDPLGRWVRIQRQQYRSGTLSKERIAQLEAIGFIWFVQRGRRSLASPPDSQPRLPVSWDEMFEKLVEFYRQEGHSQVPCASRRKDPLGTWVSNQRQAFKKGKLSTERIEKLESIDFVWKVVLPVKKKSVAKSTKLPDREAPQNTERKPLDPPEYIDGMVISIL